MMNTMASSRLVSAVPSRVQVCAPRALRKQQVARKHITFASAQMNSPVVDDAMTRQEIKSALLDSFWGTERGLSATSETRAEINELITQLEAVTPIAEPTEDMDTLGGMWKLLYTSNSELMALLALSKLPLVEVDEITQAINPLANTVVNTVVVSSPFSKSTFGATASIEVRSPKRLQLRFEQGSFGTPELYTDAELPSSTTILGQNIDLTPLKSAISPLREASRETMQQVASFIRQQPNLDFPITSDRAQSWLLVTYLDDTLRISRGDGGSVFVLAKQAPPAPVIVELSDSEDESDDEVIVFTEDAPVIVPVATVDPIVPVAPVDPPVVLPTVPTSGPPTDAPPSAGPPPPGL